jgi:hypothetical protein
MDSIIPLFVSNFEGYGIVQGPRKNFVDIATKAGCDILYYNIETEIDSRVLFTLLEEKPINKTILFLNITIDVKKDNVSFIIQTTSYCICSRTIVTYIR